MRRDQVPLCLAALGPMRAWRYGAELSLGPPKQRAVLGMLLGRVNDVIGFDEIIDAVWGHDVPRTAANGVHTYVAGLRRALEPGRGRRQHGEVLVSTGGGYALFMEPDHVDTTLFTARHRRARRLRETGDGVAAADVYRDALRLWRGEAYFGIPGPFAELERTRLTSQRLTIVEELAELLLELHRPADAVAMLSDAVTKEPLREKLRGLLMLALYRSGRQADALHLYRQTRRLLREELGIEPVLELRDLHTQILVGHPDLDSAPPSVPPPQRPAADRGSGEALRPAQLPFRSRGFTGRSDELARLRELVARDRHRPDATTVTVLEGGTGVGKTALAVEFAHEVAEFCPDGQLFVDLRGFGPGGPPLSAQQALVRLLGSLGIERRRVPDDLASAQALCRSVLHGRRMLVVLDDAADAGQVRPLIPAGPACVLVTSRRRQRGLAARNGAYRIPLGPLPTADAVDLLIGLGGRERSGGQDAEYGELAELCGCLPLALRIAAGALAADPALTPAELVRRYRPAHEVLNHLEVLGDASSDIRAALATSYQALPADAARMFRTLGYFPGSVFSVQRAAVLAGVTVPQALGQLQVLVDHYLLDVDGGRYRLPPLVGAYATECGSGERHVDRPDIDQTTFRPAAADSSHRRTGARQRRPMDLAPQPTREEIP